MFDLYSFSKSNFWFFLDTWKLIYKSSISFKNTLRGALHMVNSIFSASHYVIDSTTLRIRVHSTNSRCVLRIYSKDTWLVGPSLSISNNAICGTFQTSSLVLYDYFQLWELVDTLNAISSFLVRWLSIKNIHILKILLIKNVDEILHWLDDSIDVDSVWLKIHRILSK